MDLSVELYVIGGGRCLAQEFLGALKRTDPRDFAGVLVGWPARETTGLLSALAARRIADCLGAGRTFGGGFSPPPPPPSSFPLLFFRPSVGLGWSFFRAPLFVVR